MTPIPKQSFAFITKPRCITGFVKIKRISLKLNNQNFNYISYFIQFHLFIHSIIYIFKLNKLKTKLTLKSRNKNKLLTN